MFLIKQDLINTLNEQDIDTLSSDDNEITKAINKAVEEGKSLIQHRYEESVIFPEMPNFSSTVTYAIDTLIYYHIETPWSSEITYDDGDRVLYDGVIYESLQGTNLNKLPNEQTDYWVAICDDYEKFNCIKEALDKNPGDTEYWTKGDTRNSLIVDAVSIIAIYNLFRKCQPRTIPEWISVELDRMVAILREVGNGKRMLVLEVVTNADAEELGHNIVYGSEETKDWNI